ncbi:MAG: 3-phosphoshikimate 1-carboxyvinyltransferase [Planctomycetaceae bacterium]|nr:3-phosphoshikimate 1-carboxyvinyltransferase [Planctomycetaceae bacterium]MBT4724762.1 3-phosphoshikimate 1-carboxyvinyltransferase [Planctomycetaceae bacterium]MBT4844099.1 3-phosphoshikimate 1-carboxyvinyltransferase [Planctomycetaceae bacterium]MBT5124326.1 3-phosphoshikimate 1-carboxyvinyltransferase [Planctomycetaceae bacterium]MBT5599131.1 3-phosphoshikimate 1-carboxyvinyltransferase [Planctomycetaceae bacterium]
MFHCELSTRPVSGEIRPPGSKSITNRALVCAAMANGTSVLRHALDCDDTNVMVAALQKLGLSIDWRKDTNTLIIQGCGGQVPVTTANLYVGNSGTTIRFLTSVLASMQGEFVLDGVARMQQRPIHDLVEALKELGADVQCAPNGCPPVTMIANGFSRNTCQIAGNVSSQFLSGLMLAMGNSSRDIELHLTGTLVSEPYIQMTIDVLSVFGRTVRRNENNVYSSDGQQTASGAEYDIEPDASAASYFFAAAAVTGGTVTVRGLSKDSIQGDIGFCHSLEQMGCQIYYGTDFIRVQGGELIGIDIDMNAISDTVLTLAVVALFAQGQTTIRNVQHIRDKETDRITDLSRELRRLGAVVEEFEDGMKITPSKYRGAIIETYDDHRMAMSFAIAGLRIPDISISDPKCCHKTYPNYFEDLASLIDN